MQTVSCWLKYSDDCAFTMDNVGKTFSNYTADQKGNVSLGESVAMELNAPVVGDLLYYVVRSTSYLHYLRVTQVRAACHLH
jgi:hypothetical protein